MIKRREDEEEDVSSYYIGKDKMTIRRGRRCKQLLDDVKEKRGYWKLKQEALDRTPWRSRCGRGHGPVVREQPL